GGIERRGRLQHQALVSEPVRPRTPSALTGTRRDVRTTAEPSRRRARNSHQVPLPSPPLQFRAACLAALGVAALAGCGGGRKSAKAAAARPSPAPAAGQVARSARADSGAPIPLSSLKGRIAFSHDDDVWVAHADGTHARRLTHSRGAEF